MTLEQAECKLGQRAELAKGERPEMGPWEVLFLGSVSHGGPIPKDESAKMTRNEWLDGRPVLSLPPAMCVPSLMTTHGV